MKIRTKILLLAILPLVLAIFAINATVYLINQSQIATQQSELRAELMADKKSELSTYLQIAQTAIADVYAQPDSTENREQVKKILRQLRYGKDGYFFVYNYEGVNQVLGPKPETEGKNLFNAKDAGGKFFIQDILNAARNGDGYAEYLWNKPSIGRDGSKLSYTSKIPSFLWAQIIPRVLVYKRCCFR